MGNNKTNHSKHTKPVIDSLITVYCQKMSKNKHIAMTYIKDISLKFQDNNNISTYYSF